MTIKLYNFLGYRNTVIKTLTAWDTSEITGTLREETSVEDPEILIEMTVFPGFNYAYIPEFDRYYFVQARESVRNNLWRITLHVDVLMTYHEELIQETAIISRNQSLYNNWLIDDKIPATNERVVDAPLVFPNTPFTPTASHANSLVLEGMWGDTGT